MPRLLAEQECSWTLRSPFIPTGLCVVELTKWAEQLGFTHAWTFDSHIFWQKHYVIYLRMLSATERIMVGQLVTNPTTRDPSVTASLLAILNDMFGNRTIYGIGRCDSACRILGKKPATLAYVGESIRLIKDLAEGRKTDINGRKVRTPRIKNGRLDVWMAGYGPKTLALAGRLAGGIIMQLADPYVLE